MSKSIFAQMNDGEMPVQQAATVVHPELVDQLCDTPATHTPYDLTPVRAALQPYEDQMNALIKEAATVKITDQASAEAAVELANRAKTASKKIETFRKATVAKPNAYVKEVNALCKYYASKLAQPENEVKRKYAAYQEEEDRKRIEAERKAREEAARLQREAEEQARKAREEAAAKNEEPPAEAAAPVVTPQAIPKQESVVRSKAGTAHVRTVWKFEVTDEQAIPREFLKVDESKIRAAVKDGVREIPGVIIFEEKTTTLRTS